MAALPTGASQDNDKQKNVTDSIPTTSNESSQTETSLTVSSSDACLEQTLDLPRRLVNAMDFLLEAEI
jgi:hypothetical protein